LRQAVQSLRTKYDINIGRAFDDGIAFLRGDTATDTDQQIRLLRFSSRRRPRSENTFRMLFHARCRYSAESRQHHPEIGFYHAISGIQHVCHFV
jgi:hypothetical protein